MSERDTFGPRLRSERERRGISLKTIVDVTKVGADLWQGLERSDISRWPSGIFARAFVREYAKVVGLDVEEVVDEFCRLFPHGDRRATRIIKAQAELLTRAPPPRKIRRRLKVIAGPPMASVVPKCARAISGSRRARWRPPSTSPERCRWRQPVRCS